MMVHLKSHLGRQNLRRKSMPLRILRPILCLLVLGLSSLPGFGNSMINECVSGAVVCSNQIPLPQEQNTSQKTASSQSETLAGKIKGQILDYETQEPIEGVKVSIKETDLEVRSGPDGSYGFSEISVGFYILIFQREGYYSDTRTDVIVRSNRTTFLNLEMLKVRAIEERVDVTAGYFPKIQTQTGSQLEINAEELRRDAGSAGDVSRALYNVPGVIKADEEANDLIVRGGSPTENGFYIDNIFVPNINHFPQMAASGGNISMLNMDFIERIQIWTGGFDASYGNRLSSILDIGYREGNRERINSQVNFSIIGYGAQIEGPFSNKKGSWMISANHSFLDLIRDLISDEDQRSSYYDFQGKMNYDISDLNKISFLFLGGHSQTLYEPEGAEKFDQMTVGVNWRHLWGGLGYSDTSVSYSSQKGKENNWSSENNNLISNFDYKNGTVTLRNINQFQLHPFHQLKFGFEAQNLRFRSLDYYDASMQKFNGTFGAAFLTYAVHLFPNVSLSAGLRLDFFPFSDRFHLSPRFNLTWEFAERFSLNGAFGLFYQQMPLFLLKQHSGNVQLQDPRAQHVVLGLKYLWNENTQVTLEAYDKKYDHFPMSPSYPYFFVIDDVKGDSDAWRFWGMLVDEGKAYARGVELTVQKKLVKNFYGLINLTYYRARYRDLMGIWRNRLYDNRFIFCIAGGYKPSKHWEFNVRWIWSGNKAFTPVNEEMSKLTGWYYVEFDDIMAGHLSDYRNLSLRGDRRFYFNKTNLVLYAGALNILNRKNELERLWIPSSNAYDSVYMWGIIPYIGLEFEF